MDSTSTNFFFGEGNTTNLIQNLKGHFDFLVSDKLQHDLLLVKILFILFSIFCAVAIAYLLKKTNYHHLDYLEELDILKDFKDFGATQALKQWKKIKKNFEKDDPVYRKLALLEAEKMLDEILKRMGLGPGTMDERLSKITQDDLPNLADILKARALCQDIAQDPDFQLDKEKAEIAFSAFEKALVSLQVF